MAIYPLSAATDGLIGQRDPLIVGVRGLLITDFIPIDPQVPEIKPPVGGGGKGFTYKGWKDSKNKDIKFDFLKMEDEEIMIIIKTFMKCQ